MEELKGYVTQMIFRWLLKIIGGYFTINGVVNPDISDGFMQIAGGVAAILVGVIISVWQHRKALGQPPVNAFPR